MRSWTISASAFKIRSPQKILLMQLKPRLVSVFSMQENIELARQFLLEQFVSRGMVM